MATEYQELVQGFIHSKRIGVVGLSSHTENPGNHILKKLLNNGYEAIPIHPKAKSINGIDCFESVEAVPVQLEAVVICTPSNATTSIIESCALAGVKLVWIHKSIGDGSYSQVAVDKAKQLGIKVIPTGCPMMFIQPDIFHRCMRFLMKSKLRV